jgi:hypothetical protein
MLLLLLLLGCCAGPLLPLDLPRLEHICTSCFPACVGDKCLLSIEVTYPKVRTALPAACGYERAWQQNTAEQNCFRTAAHRKGLLVHST